jgi:Holliday junction resolvase
MVNGVLPDSGSQLLPRGKGPQGERMSASQRNKGARGEREVAKLIHDHLGFEVTRRCRQYESDSDLVGIPGWSVEVKNHATITRAGLIAWWEQACLQAGDDIPCLAYKRGRAWWRFMWPANATDTTGPYLGWEYTVEGEAEAWAAVVRETLPPT